LPSFWPLAGHRNGEDLRRYQVHQTETGAQPPTVNSSAVALRFLFT